MRKIRFNKEICAVLAALFILSFANGVFAQEQVEWQEFETEHFIIRYDGLDNSTLSMIAEEAENAYDKVTFDLQCHPENKTVVLIGTAKEDHEWAEGAGFYTRGSNLIGLLSPEQLRWTNYESYIRKSMHHEYTHHVIFSEYNMVFPGWLNEGVATYEAGEKPEDQHEYKEFQNAAAKDKLVPLYEMGIFDLLEDDERHLAYLESYTVIEFIESEYGHDALIDLLKTQREYNLDYAINSTFGLTHDEFQTAWMAYVKEKYGKPSYDYVYISLYLILVALLLRRRRRRRAERRNDTNSGS